MSTKEQEEDIVLQLVSNKDFKDWVLNPSGDRDFYWQSWLKANPQQASAFNKACEIISQLKFKEEFLSDHETARLLENIIADKLTASAGKVVSINRDNHFRWIKVAASLLIILGSSLYAFRFFSSTVAVFLTRVETANGQRQKITLPDGSVAHLNAGTTLVFPEEFSDTIRTVELHGEAFFEVVKNTAKPFIVTTHDVRTRVLGTSFNVRAFDAESSTDVSLVTGKVRVSGVLHPAEHMLLPGEHLVYHKADKSFLKGQFNVDDVIGWKDGVLIFDNTDFQGVISRLEQWYGVKVQVLCKPSSEWHMNGHFDQQSLTEVLTSIQFVYDIQFEIKQENTLILKCK